jgi:hypothetical protein
MEASGEFELSSNKEIGESENICCLWGSRAQVFSPNHIAKYSLFKYFSFGCDVLL